MLAVVTGARGELPLVAGDDLTLFWGGDAAGYVQAGLFALNVPQDVTLRMELTDDETGASMGRSGFDTFRVTLVPVAELGELDPDGPWTCRGVTSTLPLSVDPGALILEEGPPQGYFGRSVTLGFTVSVRDRDDRLEAIASTRLMLELAPP